MKNNSRISHSGISYRRISTVLLLLSIVTMLHAEQAPATGDANELYGTIDTYLDRQLERLNIPGAVLAVVEGAEISHVYSYGVTGPKGAAPDLTTPMIIGSLTKSFTAMAVMQLAQKGALDPDAPVKEYLPWFKLADAEAAATMTVRHLLNQTSGLSMFSGMKLLANFDASPDACEQRARELKTFSPSRKPGEEFEYSDINFNLLGLVIEAASGESYGDYIERHIFDPLGMVHSHTNHTDAAEDGMAVGHIMYFGKTRPVPGMQRPTGSTPSGQLVSSAGDIGRYMSTMLGNGTLGDTSILSPEYTAELTRPAVPAGSMGVDMGDYAMGWFVEDTQGELRIWHDGMVPDFFSYMVLLPEQNRGVIFLVNANHMIVNYSLLDVSEAVTDILTGQPLETGDLGGIYKTLRFFLLVPALQLLGILFMVTRILRWSRNPERLPIRPVLSGVYLFLGSIPHFLLVAVTSVLLFMGMARFSLLFMPDLAGLLLICGGISLAWFVLRIRLIRRVARPLRRPKRDTVAV